MGDVGALALAASWERGPDHQAEILLAIVGGLFVVEALSVILQVSFFKVSNAAASSAWRRCHHFELKGGLNKVMCASGSSPSSWGWCPERSEVAKFPPSPAGGEGRGMTG
jgi:UDP-N-acetylmuramyl pentapeptide phosphotransferase/UDP-N-acetylglucosamine-1-phosphate transferase